MRMHFSTSGRAVLRNLRPCGFLPAAIVAGLISGITGCHRAAPAGSLAEVNGAPISAARVDEYDRLHPQAFSGETGEQRRLDVLGQVIIEEILEQRAGQYHLEATDEDASEKLTEMKASYTQEEFQQQLSAANLTMQDMQLQVRRELTIDRLLNKDVFSRINVTDADLSTYYTSHEEEFNLAEPRYHLARIVVSALPEPAAPSPVSATPALSRTAAAAPAVRQQSREDALRTIQMAHIRLQEGEDFTSLANGLAKIKTASITGDEDIALTQSQLDADPMLRESISKLLPGQATDVLQSPDGNEFAIYKLLFREPAGLYGFGDPRVQQYIREKLRAQRAELLKSAYLDMLRYQAHIENYYAQSLLR
jgi:peptidyl-prolyl cis-trans isomerase SurA